MFLNILVGDVQLASIPKSSVSIKLIIRANGKDYPVQANWAGGSSLVRFHRTVHVPLKDEKESTRLSSDLIAVSNEGKDDPIGHNQTIVTDQGHALSKVVVFSAKDLDSAVTARLTMTVFYNKVPIDLANEKLLTDREVKRIAAQNAAKSNQREYSFLLTRRLNWAKKVPSSFSREMEKQLDSDVTMHLKDLRDSIMKAKKPHNSGAAAAKKGAKQGELIRSALSPSKASFAARAKKPAPKFEAAKLRKTNSGVGYAGVAWPNIDKGARQEKVLYKLNLAEQLRLKLVKSVADQRRAIGRNRDLALKAMSEREEGLRRRIRQEQEALLQTKQIAEVLKNKQREIKNLKLELEQQKLQRARVKKGDYSSAQLDAFEFKNAMRVHIKASTPLAPYSSSRAAHRTDDAFLSLSQGMPNVMKTGTINRNRPVVSRVDAIHSPLGRLHSSPKQTSLRSSSAGPAPSSRRRSRDKESSIEAILEEYRESNALDTDVVVARIRSALQDEMRRVKDMEAHMPRARKPLTPSPPKVAPSSETLQRVEAAKSNLSKLSALLAAAESKPAAASGGDSSDLLEKMKANMQKSQDILNK